MNQPRRVVLVEDNPADVRLVEEAMRWKGIDVALTHLASSDHAIAVLSAMPAEECPELLLIDLNLPAGDGFAVLRAIRSNPNLQAAAVAVLTSSVAPWDIEQISRFGVPYIWKPVTLDEFLDTVGDAVHLLLRGAQPIAR